jgi:diacylglycerol kinase (ATP)
MKTSLGKKRLVLIINPVSGTKRKNHIPTLVQTLLEEQFDVDVQHSNFPGHAREIASNARINKADLVVVAGGDGTINEAAGSLINSSVKFGIIPMGSGNGLARHLSIPMNLKNAVEIIGALKTQTIDAGLVNDLPFFCTAGIGFDAYIGHEFKHGKSRGIYGYANHILREYFNYSPESYNVSINGNEKEEEAFIITIANAGQWGNNAHIAPQANISDGLLDLCVVSKFPKLKGLKMSLQLFSKNIANSPYYSNTKIQSVKIGSLKNSFFHLDGEVFPLDKPLDIRVIPGCLEVIVP